MKSTGNINMIKQNKILFSCFIWCSFINISYSQTPGEWTWMHGSNSSNSPGVYGVQGVANPANMPRALYEPCEWKDKNGNFWLFGGTDGTARYSALWKFDPNSSSPTYNQWTWMKGPSAIDQQGVCITQGVPSPANYPGARAWGASTWADTSGNLWLFGGTGYDANGGYGNLNDLWKYDPDPGSATYNQWTLVKGPGPTSFGTKGVSSPANLPPARTETSCTWTDNFGNLWLFGGYSYDDLWKYNISTNEWTWMTGSNTTNLPPVFGTQGVADPANTPGYRMVYSSWTDMAGNLWLFGGQRGGFDLNDLWKYDPNPASPTYNQWTWMGGSTNGFDAGNYGSKCVSTGSNKPSARFENRARVRDACGNFWMYGGRLSSSNLSDLWHYNVTTNQWTWVSGNSVPGFAIPVYGTKGISDPACRPGARLGNVAWMDNEGYIWIFGGLASGSSEENDLFRFVPDSFCIPICKPCSVLPVVTVSATNNIRPGDTTILNCNSTSITSFNWSPAIGLSCITCKNPIASPSVSTNYCVTVTDANGCTNTACISVTVESGCEKSFIPSAFSPNADGQNDIFYVKGNCIKSLIIFDRWGQKIFETDDITIGWDGTFKEKMLDTGVFVYIVYEEDDNGQGITKTGNIALIR